MQCAIVWRTDLFHHRRVAILDAGDIVYVWVGARSKRNAKEKLWPNGQLLETT